MSPTAAGRPDVPRKGRPDASEPRVSHPGGWHTGGGIARGRADGRHRLAMVVMAASGFAGLGYQIVWTQQASVWLGHESAAVLAVITAFFGGLALGSFACGPMIERSARPERWYASCEILIGVWGVVVALVMPGFGEALLRLTGAQPSALWQWAVAFCGTFVLLLPATAAMGATLPAMERVTSRLHEGRRFIGALYASNTLGAVVGVLAAAFFLIPEMGLGRTAVVCVGFNFLCAVGVFFGAMKMPSIAGRRGAAEARSDADPRAGTDAGPCAGTDAGPCAGTDAGPCAGTDAGPCAGTDAGPCAGTDAGPRASNDAGRRASTADADTEAGAHLDADAHSRTGAAGDAGGVLVCLAVTGLLGIGYEVVVVRVLSQVAENTVYTFAMLLAVYLVGTAAGAAMYQRSIATAANPTRTQDLLFSALGIACLVSTACLWHAEAIKQFALYVLGTSMAAALAGEAVLAIVAFGPPTLVMGALFSHLASRASAFGVSFGRALAVNTLGATCAPLVFGVLVLPAFGAKAALLLIGVAYLTLITRTEWRSPKAWVPVGAAAALALLAPRLVFVDVPEGGRVVSYREGVMGAVSVVEDAEGVLRLRIDNRQQEGSSATLRVDGRQGLLPVFLHPAPRRALFLGLGTGVTASAAAEVPTLSVDAVELVPEVIDAAPLFTRAVMGEAPNTRLKPIPADARRYVRASNQRYDVIVSDNFHPARSGSGALYTVEHFAAVRERLTPDGVFCQWIPLHQLDLQTLRSIVRSFLAVYPQGAAMLASNSLETPVVGLVGRADSNRFDIAALQARLASRELADLRDAIGIEDEYALLGSFIAGPRALKRFAGNAPLNTDDHPVVAYSAPRITYAPDSEPRERLYALLAESTIEPPDVIGPVQESAAPAQEAAALAEEPATAASLSDVHVLAGELGGAAEARIGVVVRHVESARLHAYWQARNRFIHSGRNVQPSSDVRAMLAQVREPLLATLRISPDFRPAYEPLLRMAVALSESDPSAARDLLKELIRLQPARPEAAIELHRLD